MSTETSMDSPRGALSGHCGVSAADLSRRQLRVLFAVVEQYLRTGEPVASVHVARSSRLDLSPATIRNVLAELEADGLVTRPHVSSGCVPSDACLRLYVDAAAPRLGLSGRARARLAERIAKARRELVEDIEWVARLVAEETHEAGVAIRPMDSELELETVSLVPLAEGRVLGVVVTVDGSVEKRVLTPAGSWSRPELQELANFLSSTYGGHTGSDVRYLLENGTLPADVLPGRPRESLLEVARQLFSTDLEAAEVRVVGTDRLVQTQDFDEVDRMRSLLTVLQDRSRIVEEWRRLLVHERSRVVIGHESEVTASGRLGMVATAFFRDGRRVGAVGVVGPRRMDYVRIVPLVEYVGDALTRMLGPTMSDSAR